MNSSEGSLDLKDSIVHYDPEDLELLNEQVRCCSTDQDLWNMVGAANFNTVSHPLIAKNHNQVQRSHQQDDFYKDLYREI